MDTLYNNDWHYTAHLTDLDIRKLLLESVAKLQTHYDIDLTTDLGFGYTLEQTIKHMQDEDADGKRLVEMYRLFLENHYMERDFGTTISRLRKL